MVSRLTRTLIIVITLLCQVGAGSHRVGQSVRPSILHIPELQVLGCISSPAQLSVTVLP